MSRAALLQRQEYHQLPSEGGIFVDAKRQDHLGNVHVGSKETVLSGSGETFGLCDLHPIARRSSTSGRTAGQGSGAC